MLWALMVVTNTHIDPTSYITQISALDTSIYLDIARSAPGLPQAGSKLVYHGAQRIFFPYLIGLFAKGTGLDVWLLFQLIVVLCTLVTVCIFWRIALHVCAGRRTPAIMMTSILICHPFLFRLQIAFAGFLNDAIFDVGLALFTCSLLIRSPTKRVLGVFLMIPTKQTVFLIMPFVFAAEWFLSPSRRRSTTVFWLSAITGTVLYYAVIKRIILPFSSPDTTASMALGLWTWVKSIHGPEALVQWMQFIGRGVLGLLPFVAVLGALRSEKRRIIVTDQNKILLVLSVATIAQPVISGPLITDASIQRLFSLGFIPMFAFLGASLKDMRFRSKWMLGATIATIFLGSIHHLFSFIGPDLTKRFVFLALNVISATGLYFFVKMSLQISSKAIDIDQNASTL